MITERTSAVSGEGGSRCVRYERDTDESTSVAVATALAEFRGEDVTGPGLRLYDHVDPEALDALFATTRGDSNRAVSEVCFDVEDATVVVRPESVRVY